MCVSVWASLCVIYWSLSVCVSVSVSLCICPLCVSDCPCPLCFSVSVCTSVCLCVPVYRSVCLHLGLSGSLYLSECLYASLCLRVLDLYLLLCPLYITLICFIWSYSCFARDAFVPILTSAKLKRSWDVKTSSTVIRDTTIWAELNIPSTGISSDTGLNLGINTWITLQQKLGESGTGREDLHVQPRLRYQLILIVVSYRK